MPLSTVTAPRPRTTRRSRLAGACLLAGALAGCTEKPPESKTVVLGIDYETLKLASAVIQVDYSDSGATPLLRGGRPECTYIHPDVGGSFDDTGRAIRMTVNSRKGFRGPIDLAACRLIPDSDELETATLQRSLQVRVSEATDPDGKKVDARRASAERGAASSTELADAARAANRRERASGGTRSHAGTPANSADNARDASGTNAHAPEPSAVERANKTFEKEQLDTRSYFEERRRQMAAASEATREAMIGGRQPERSPGAKGWNGLPGFSNSGGAAGGEGDADADPGSFDGGTGAAPVAPRGTDPDYDESDCENATGYIVVVGSDRNSEDLGAIQFNVRHRGSSGCFVDSPDGTPCDATNPELFNAGNYRGTGVASFAAISLAPFQTNRDFVRCYFNSDQPVSASSFDIEIIDAADLSANPISVPPMRVMSVSRR